MTFLDRMKTALGRLDFEALADMRPAFPPVAVEIDRDGLVLVRLRSRGRGRFALESHQLGDLPDHVVGASMLRPNLLAPEEVVARVKHLFERSGTRPGKVSLILPDNLARVSIVTLPEKPATRKLLSEMLRFKLRRSVPFRLEDAVIAHQPLGGDGPDYPILVAVMLRSVVEQYERVLDAVGATPGLVDLSTTSLYNLVRGDVSRLGAAADTALVNCTRGYLSLLIARGGRVIFFRCKSHASGDEPAAGAASGSDGAMAREVATSVSYYREKLQGEGISRAWVRTIGTPFEELEAILRKSGVDEVVPVDPAPAMGLDAGLKLDGALAQRLAPCLGATAGRAA